MTTTEITVIISSITVGLSSIIAPIISAWRADQAIRERAVTLAEQTQKYHEEQMGELRHNTKLTQIGNDVKTDLLITQKEIVEIKKDINNGK